MMQLSIHVVILLIHVSKNGPLVKDVSSAGNQRCATTNKLCGMYLRIARLSQQPSRFADDNLKCIFVTKHISMSLIHRVLLTISLDNGLASNRRQAESIDRAN